MNKHLNVLAYIYSVRIYAAAISIVLVPWVIKLVGYDAYGLVGFFAILLACMNILDAGIGGVLTRQAIVSRTSRGQFSQFLSVFRKVIILFVTVGIAVALLGSLLAQHYGKSWLNTSLSHQEVAFCTSLMFCIFAVHYIQGPWRSLLLSNESQATLATINFVYMSLSQPGALLLLIYYRQDIKFYFFAQLIAAIINTSLMIFYGERVKRKIVAGLRDVNEVVNRLSLRSLLLFALQLSLLSILWIIVNQSDKLALTRFMALSDYAKYSVAVSLTTVVAIISDPLNQVLLPRLTRSWHEKNFAVFARFFFAAYSFVCLLLVPLSAFMFFFANDLLYLWSNDRVLAEGAARYLPWLFAGSVFAVLSNLCFLLRYSSGQLKNHTLIYLLFSVLVVPLNVIVARVWQGEGTSLFFAASSGLLFLLWAGYNFHRYFVSGAALLYQMLLPVILISLVWFWFIARVDIPSTSRVVSFAILMLKGLGGTVLTGGYILLIRNKINITIRASVQ
ncbi:O10 family O-antigen flippase [Erwinia sp. E602]|uniref:lipopolysaccharide biosynthesis protein n=1 Tax=Erwinia sp. E602 TaxID=2675378 RepID=UPI001BADFA50|nr:MATE family efflux transporter [Erwinia sp. E602]QUG75137.1 O10 family O-antigen flippase [Erwinia sp. E602]